MNVAVPRTSINDFALDILDLVGQKLDEATREPQSRKGALTEASAGLKILRGRLVREDANKSTQLMLVFDDDLEELVRFEGGEFDKRACGALRRLEGAKSIFGSLD